MKDSEIVKATLHKADGVLYPVSDRKDKGKGASVCRTFQIPETV